MLETNVNNFSEENKYHAYVKTETKGDYNREAIKDNTIRPNRKVERKVKLFTEGGQLFPN